MPITIEQLEKLRTCDCGKNHQVDDGEPGVLATDGYATTCPAEPTFNAEFARRQGHQ